MVYFDDNLVKFPRHFTENDTKIIFISELTGEKTEFEVVNQSDNIHFYTFDLSGLDLTAGVYEYRYGKEVGLFQVGDFVHSKNEYNKDTKKTVIYEG